MVFLQLIAALAAAKTYLHESLPWIAARPSPPPLPHAATWGVDHFTTATCPSLSPPLLLLDTFSTVYFILNCPRCETRRTLSKFCSLRPPALHNREDAKASLARIVIDSPHLRTRLCVAEAKHTNKTLELSWGTHGHYISHDNHHIPTLLLPIPSLDLESDDDDLLDWPLNDDT
jgi:hypothetical protein